MTIQEMSNFCNLATAAALFDTNSTTHFHHTQRSEPRNYAESLTKTNRKEEAL